MKYVKLILMFVLLATLVIASYTFISMADEVTVEGVTKSLEENTPDNSDVTNKIKELGQNVVYAIKFVGTALGIILLVWFGIKWMTSNPQKKSELKDQMWNYVIGALLLFGAGPIASWIYSLANQIKG